MKKVYKLAVIAAFTAVHAIAASQTFKGLVTLVNISGNGPNSAQLEFSLVSGTTARTFVVLAAPSSEPQVFVSISNLVTAALLANKVITVTYESVPGQTDRATAVEISAGPVTKKSPKL